MNTKEQTSAALPVAQAALAIGGLMAKRNAMRTILPHSGHEHPNGEFGQVIPRGEGGAGATMHAVGDVGSIHEERVVRAATEQRVEIALPKLNLQTLTLKVVGDSPLVSHAWSEKAMKQMLDKQMKKAKGAREAKDPHKDFLDSMYWITERPKKDPTVEQIATGKFKFGIPAISFKKAAVDACSFVEGITKVEGRGAFHTVGELLEIEGSPPRMRKDMVRIAMGTSDIRFRAEFFPWSVKILVRYNAAVLSPEQLVNLFSVAGFSIGVGENRPQRNGQWGMFSVK